MQGEYAAGNKGVAEKGEDTDEKTK